MCYARYACVWVICCMLFHMPAILVCHTKYRHTQLLTNVAYISGWNNFRCCWCYCCWLCQCECMCRKLQFCGNHGIYVVFTPMHSSNWIKFYLLWYDSARIKRKTLMLDLKDARKSLAGHFYGVVQNHYFCSINLIMCGQSMMANKQMITLEKKI